LVTVEVGGITGDLLNWFKAFLTAHHQQVVVNGQFSSFVPVTSAGCTSGLSLGSSAIINDIFTVVSHSYLLTIYKEISYPNYLNLICLI